MLRREEIEDSGPMLLSVDRVEQQEGDRVKVGNCG